MTDLLSQGGGDVRPALAPRSMMVVDNAHVTYRVFASGKRMSARDGLLSVNALRGGRDLHSVEALRGVSFTASEGETIGVVGHNGSGKSTLFRAMSGLLPTSQGAIWAADRPVLLGVNAALVPELSGENNIKLGLLAMGFSTEEAADLVPEIADFAELNEFLYHPMRTYSSGMGARLRFAIASAKTHSILLVDEALAVGDRRFRMKSEQRIRNLKDNAGLVMIVSHSASSLRDTCERVLWIHKGELRADGPASAVISDYVRWTKQPGGAAVGAASVTKAKQARTRDAGAAAARTGPSPANSTTTSTRDAARRERFNRDQRLQRRKSIAAATATAVAVLIAGAAGAAVAVLAGVSAPPPTESAPGTPGVGVAPHILSFSATDAAAACSSEEGETEVRLAWAVEGAENLALAADWTVTDAIDAPLRGGLSASETAYAVPFPCTAEQRVYTLTAEGSDGSHVSSVVVVERSAVPTPEPTEDEPEGDEAPVVPWRPAPVNPVPVVPAPVDPAPVVPAPVDPAPVDPAPVDPTPVDPAPVDPTPVDPAPVDPAPVDPPVEPAPDDGTAVQP